MSEVTEQTTPAPEVTPTSETPSVPTVTPKAAKPVKAKAEPKLDKSARQSFALPSGAVVTYL